MLFLNIMLTKKCSLKCKGCMNMSNNLFDKEDYDLNLFENDIKHLSSLNINFVVKFGSFCNYCFNFKHTKIPFETNKAIKEDYIQ